MEKPPHSTRTIRLIGIIEILIGGLTLLVSLTPLLLGIHAKTTNVFTFVMITGVTSALLGIGILRHHGLAYQLLLYFSSVIILSKILILTNIIQLNGALEGVVPSALNSWISISYHGAVIYYLCRSDTKRHFFG